MKKHIKGSILILTICLMSSCEHKIESSENIVKINNSLDSMIFTQFNDFKKNSGSSIRNNIDSVYLIGNKLIEEIDDINFQKKYSNFCREYGENSIESDFSNDKNYIKTRIKLIQLNYINQNIQFFYQSHFQLDLIGLVPLKRTIKKGGKEKLKLIPDYISSENSFIPIVTINDDTLNYDGLFYEYNYNPKKTGIDTIKPEIIIKRWDDTIKIKCWFYLNVE